MTNESKTAMQLREEVRRSACIEAVYRQFPFVQKAHDLLQVALDKIEIGDGEEYIQADMWALTPFPHETGTSAVDISWDVMGFVEIPGRFNPRDGGTGPETQEIPLGEYDSIEKALLAIIRQNAREALSIIRQDMMFDEMADAEMEAGSLPPNCLHGERPEKCHSCKEQRDA
jgi:hypothetical protein